MGWFKKTLPKKTKTLSDTARELLDAAEVEKKKIHRNLVDSNNALDRLCEDLLADLHES